MGCCKCEDYGWDDQQDVVYVDPAGGKEYCVFHAPKDEKRKALESEERYTVEEFNELVYLRIDAVKERVKVGEKNALCDLRATVFPGDIEFWRYGTDNPLPAIAFSGATFRGVAGFRKATFSGAAWFERATFIGDAEFYWATFSGEARFYEATFSGVAWFNGATFSVEADFSDARFVKEAGFEAAVLKPNAELSLRDALFEDAADFSRARLGGPVDLHYARFSKTARFFDARFEQGADFTWARFEDDARFRGAKFGGAVDFRDMVADKDGSLHMHHLGQESLGNLVFSSAEAPSFTFRNCDWPERLGLEQHPGDTPPTRLELEELYRALKQRADDDHDRKQVSHWHAKEKEMALRRLQQGMKETTFSGLWRWVLERDGLDLRHAVERLWERLRGRLGQARPLAILDRLPGVLAPQRVFSATWWYSVSSGFGENPVRATKVLVSLIVAALALVGFVDMQDDKGCPPSSLPERLHAGFQHLLFITGPKYSPQGAGWRTLLLLLTRILIPVQFGLFALAVRNRFRR